MDFGVHLPQLGRKVDRQSIMGFAQEAERLGCHSVWVSDHLCWPAEIVSQYPYSDDGSFAPASDIGWLEALSTLAFVAGCTDRIRLGTTVLILPYRPPLQTAKQLAAIDVLSNGRLILGAGVGWMREEAELLGMPWDRRGARSDEQLAIFRHVWSEKTPAFDGTFYRFPEIGFEPKPVQDPLPIWIGGSSPSAFRRAARFGQAFHAAFQPKEVVADEWAQVQAACAEFGRDPAELSLSLRFYLDPAAAMEPEKSIAGSADRMLETIAGLQAIGVSHILLDPVARGGVAGRLDALRQFMAEVAPKA
jgi:probable F420-dependent oxidoreductase